MTRKRPEQMSVAELFAALQSNIRRLAGQPDVVNETGSAGTVPMLSRGASRKVVMEYYHLDRTPPLVQTFRNFLRGVGGEH